MRRRLLLVEGVVEPEADFLETESVLLFFICEGLNVEAAETVLDVWHVLDFCHLLVVVV